MWDLTEVKLLSSGWWHFPQRKTMANILRRGKRKRKKRGKKKEKEGEGEKGEAEIKEIFFPHHLKFNILSTSKLGI